MLLRLLSRHLSCVIWTSAIRCCMVCQRTCCGRCSLCRTLLLVFSPAHGPVATSLQCCVNYIGCWCRDEWNLRLHVNHTPYTRKLNFHSSLHRQPMWLMQHWSDVWFTSCWLQRRWHTCLQSFDLSPSMVILISTHLPAGHWLLHGRTPVSVTEDSLLRDHACGTPYWLIYDRWPAMDSLGKSTFT